MKVYVDVVNWFTRYTGGKSCIELELPSGSSAGEAAMSIGIPVDETGFITVNGTKVEKEYNLTDGDRLKIYPVIIGG